MEFNFPLWNTGLQICINDFFRVFVIIVQLSFVLVQIYNNTYIPVIIEIKLTIIFVGK